jgi:hypothetical protein
MFSDLLFTKHRKGGRLTAEKSGSTAQAEVGRQKMTAGRPSGTAEGTGNLWEDDR